MGRSLKGIAGILILCMATYACKNEDSSAFVIGNGLISNPTSIAQIDTFTVRIGTIKEDSLVTSNYSRFLLGCYIDGQFGNVKCSPVFTLGLPSDRTVGIYDVFDSIRLTLVYNGYYQGDTSVNQTIKVYKLNSELTPSDGVYSYNATKVHYDTKDLIGELVKIPGRPQVGQIVSIPLDTVMAYFIFNKFRDDPNYFTDDETFRNYLPGMVLVADTSQSSSVLGYGASATTVMMRIYFHRPGLTDTKLEFDFPMTLPSYQFNSITSYYHGLPISKLKSRSETLPSSETRNESYMQAGIGLLTKIEFPYMGSLFELPTKGKILSAQLIIRPAIGSYSNIELPDSLVLYASDNSINHISGVVVDNLANVMYGYLHRNDLLAHDTYYTFDITSYLYNELRNNYYRTDHSLLVGLRSNLFNTTVSRLIVTGPDVQPENTIEKPQLRIKYIFYE
jgi:hypothetical protein